MTIFKPLSPAENRARYLRVRQSMAVADLEPPKLHADNPLLGDEADDLPNQLHSSLRGAALKVVIPRFPKADDPNSVPGFLRLTWDATPTGTRFNYTTPIDSAITEFDLVLPEGLTVDPGSHELGYVLNHGGNTDPVESLIINIDTQAPTPNGLVTLPPEVEQFGITKTYLDNNGGVVVVGIPEYPTKKIKDTVRCYFGVSLPSAVLIGEFERPDTTTPVTFDLTSDHIGKEEGEKELWYTLEDRKGNPSAPSPFKKVNISLTDPPAGLLPPDIPLFDDDTPIKLVDLADARTPLGIGITTQYTNFIDGMDELEVTVDGTTLKAVQITGFPYYLDIPYAALFNDNLGPKKITTSYQIKRGNARHPLTGPLTKDIDVDLRRPGPGEGGENPNPDLAPVTVQGQGGNLPNVLSEDDIDQTVSVKVAVFDDVKDGDIATLIWKGVEVSQADGGVIELDGTETGELEWTIEWSVVDFGGNDAKLPVSYKLTNPAVNDNEEFSLPREVEVFIRPSVAPAVTFQYMDDDFDPPLLNCNSLRTDAVLVKCAHALVAGGENQLKGQTLSCVYQGYTDEAGATEKPNTKYAFTYTPTDQEVDAGFILKIRYQELLATGSAWGKISYVADIDGRPVESSDFVRVHMESGSGNPCPI
ncbi:MULTISPECIES: hypothetical protein [Pseudomonas]|uniref:hypothetical protein n=1 Tax=Pseudomonas TaxID=286 RepID=UPI0015757CE0|nr:MULTISPECIES: hypothetical protein [Pseudomonas]